MQEPKWLNTSEMLVVFGLICLLFWTSVFKLIF